MTKLVGLTCAVFLLTGCYSGPERVTVLISAADFSEHEISQIESAAALWPSAACSHKEITFLRVRPPIDPDETADRTIVVQRQTVRPHLGYTDWSGSTAWIGLDPDIWREDFGRVVLHEMGHAYGAGHLGPGNVMQPAIGVDWVLQPEVLTSEDVREFCAKNDCRCD